MYTYEYTHSLRRSISLATECRLEGLRGFGRRLASYSRIYRVSYSARIRVSIANEKSDNESKGEGVKGRRGGGWMVALLGRNCQIVETVYACSRENATQRTVDTDSGAGPNFFLAAMPCHATPRHATPFS